MGEVAGRFDGDLDEEGEEREEREREGFREEGERSGIENATNEEQNHGSLAVQQRQSHGQRLMLGGFSSVIVVVGGRILNEARCNSC